MMKFEQYQDKGIEFARGIADWICRNQGAHYDSNPTAGSFPFVQNETGQIFYANNWNLAFAVMGLLAASKAFGEERYEKAALRMGNYMKSLQIFDPFKPEHYGAVREMTPQTPWCYTRDALSAAWGFIELYRHTGDNEYLERARLWAEWFLENGHDEDGWPLWGVQFETYFDSRHPQMRNDIQGSFQGGSLNFFYHLAQETGDKKWNGELYVKLADYLIQYVQQPDGFFRSIERSTRKPPENDPQNGLHRANDDLGSLGLLGAYKTTGDQRYLQAIEKFLTGAFGKQREDGNFEESVACIPVVLNIIHEAGDLIDIPAITLERQEKALEALFARQSDGLAHPLLKGGILEMEGSKDVCARSACYALIVMLKLFAGQKDYLTV
jgi:hypothetical protein